MLPFGVYSIFHVATYTRTNLIPTVQPAQQLTPGSPTSKPTYKSNAVADTIGRFVKEYYDASMGLVAILEILLWGRLFLSAIAFVKGSWILITLYSAFLRSRFAQSTFVQAQFRQLEARIDSLIGAQGSPPIVRQVWDSIKLGVRSIHDVTDVGNLGESNTIQLSWTSKDEQIETINLPKDLICSVSRYFKEACSSESATTYFTIENLTGSLDGSVIEKNISCTLISLFDIFTKWLNTFELKSESYKLHELYFLGEILQAPKFQNDVLRLLITNPERSLAGVTSDSGTAVALDILYYPINPSELQSLWALYLLTHRIYLRHGRFYLEDNPINEDDNKMLQFLIDFIACAELDDSFHAILPRDSDPAVLIMDAPGLLVAKARAARTRGSADIRYPFEPGKFEEYLLDENIDEEGHLSDMYSDKDESSDDENIDEKEPVIHDWVDYQPIYKW
ncbi:hypothetical protein B7494_g1719 [Chlorociboria aeruginascens]|nr:hypothetical protein B7494_g1719 [Chlorociboria aeruginascens]